MSKKTFKDLKIGDIFYGYGDEISNYDYPKLCLFKKTGKDVATELEDGKETQHNLISEEHEVYTENNTGLYIDEKLKEVC